jgi:SAM-dependent methyltransferase
MSEASDDAQPLAAKDGAAPAAASDPSDDDVEVMAHAEVEPPPAPRHDSVSPTSRKLAPPPKPKRDSSQPASMPPPAGDGLAAVGSLRAPSAPSISYQEASDDSRDAVAAALSGGDSLRTIGEALAKDAGAFSTTETPTGGRPPVPRPRSQPGSAAPSSEIPLSSGPDTRSSQDLLRGPSEPPRPRDKVATIPDEPASSAKPKNIFAQRIIAVGIHSDRPPPPPPPPEAEPPPPTTAAPPVAVAAPPVAVAAPPVAVAAPPVAVAAPPVAVAAPPVAVAAPPVAVQAPPVAVQAPPVAVQAPPVAVQAPPVAVQAPPVAVQAPPAAAIAPPPALIAALPAAIAAPAGALAPVPEVDDDDLPHIPITTDEDEEVTAPTASSAPFESPAAPSVLPVIPDEPPPPPALASAPAAIDDEKAPDSADRIQVEELSREDAPSIPPDEPTTAAPPAPSARADAKPPPPPKRAPSPTGSTTAEQEKKKAKQKKAWWEELFSEDFVRANWKVSDEQIKREVTFVEESLGVAPGGVVLDLGCGSGQHAVELASRGYGVVGYDLSLYQLALAADLAQERSQKLNFLQGDMREMAFEEMFDGIFCWNTSFGYFEEDKNFSVAERAFRALRPGGMLLVDVMNRDFVAAHTPSSVWFEGDACVCMDDAVIDYFTSRLRVKRSVILDDGRTRECTYSVRLYSFHELGKLLHEVGFRVTEVSGHPATPGVFLGQASPRILMLAQRP